MWKENPEIMPDEQRKLTFPEIFEKVTWRKNTVLISEFPANQDQKKNTDYTQ